MISPADVLKVERLLPISETHVLLPKEYVPWEEEKEEDFFLAESLVSLSGHELYENLTIEQKRELS